MKAPESEFERFKQAWSRYPSAVDVWVLNWNHVAQPFNYGSAVRKSMYMTDEHKTMGIRSVYEMVERTVDRYGQILLTPEIELNTW